MLQLSTLFKFFEHKWLGVSEYLLASSFTDYPRRKYPSVCCATRSSMFCPVALKKLTVSLLVSLQNKCLYIYREQRANYFSNEVKEWRQHMSAAQTGTSASCVSKEAGSGWEENLFWPSITLFRIWYRANTHTLSSFKFQTCTGWRLYPYPAVTGAKKWNSIHYPWPSFKTRTFFATASFSPCSPCSCSVSTA